MKLVIDTMGGDNGIKVPCQAILNFLSKHNDVEIIAVGDKEELKELEGKCDIIDAKQALPMECSVLEAMRSKESSMFKAVEAVLTQNADGIVSCGSTGAYLSLLTLKVKKIEGILRPALISPFPTKIPGKYVVLLDVGASSENNADELNQFAIMGQAYCKSVYDNKNPNVSLISNGSEEGKGTTLSKETYALLKSNPNFLGYCEGRYVFDGKHDVVVFDGFTGNVFIKGSEGLAKMMSGMIKDCFTSSLLSKIGYLFTKKSFKSFKSTMDYKKVGGALLIGVNTVAVKAHGNSTPDSFEASMNIAYKMAKNNIIESIKKNL